MQSEWHTFEQFTGRIEPSHGDQLQLFFPQWIVPDLQAAEPLHVAEHGPSSLHST